MLAMLTSQLANASNLSDVDYSVWTDIVLFAMGVQVYQHVEEPRKDQMKPFIYLNIIIITLFFYHC